MKYIINLLIFNWAKKKNKTKMKFYSVLFTLIISVTCDVNNLKRPTIAVTILIRNKAHTLPYFLSQFERLNYPKNRISLW